MCLCVCVYVGESAYTHLCPHVCACACVRERRSTLEGDDTSRTERKETERKKVGNGEERRGKESKKELHYLVLI